MGFATRGALALLAKGFGELGYDRITANTMFVNTGSRHVMEKCGLSYSRTYFEEWLCPVENDEYGEAEYVLAREEWLGRR